MGFDNAGRFAVCSWMNRSGVFDWIKLSLGFGSFSKLIVFGDRHSFDPSHSNLTPSASFVRDSCTIRQNNGKPSAATSEKFDQKDNLSGWDGRFSPAEFP